MTNFNLEVYPGGKIKEEGYKINLAKELADDLDRSPRKSGFSSHIKPEYQYGIIK